MKPLSNFCSIGYGAFRIKAQIIHPNYRQILIFPAVKRSFSILAQNRSLASSHTTNAVHRHLPADFRRFSHYNKFSNINIPEVSRQSPRTTYQTLAFYKLYPVPNEILPSLRDSLLSDLNEMKVVGRLYISVEGINAQLSCPVESIDTLQHYRKERLVKVFGDDLMEFNFATEHRRAFQKLKVIIKKQIVADDILATSIDITKQAVHLSPAAFHSQLQNHSINHGNSPLIIDMRNAYESEIGYFENAIRPDVDTFRESVKAMKKICENVDKNEEIFMYCTGGIRCTKAGAILRNAGYENVKTIEGGITAYGRWLRESGMPKSASLFKGKNFTFDARLGEPISDDVITHCHLCGTKSDTYTNCVHAHCNLLFITCDSCKVTFKGTCGRSGCIKVINDYYEFGIGVQVEKEGMLTLDGENRGRLPGQIVIVNRGSPPELDHPLKTRPKIVLKLSERESERV